MTWTALILELDSDIVWKSEVEAPTEAEALRNALEVFIKTEDTEGVSFDFTSLTVELTE